MFNNRSSIACLAAISILAGARVLAATTESEGADSRQLEEITVTAQKRSERINDVPMSINAITGAQLEKRGIDDVSDLGKVAPGFTYQPSDYGSPIYAIRGIGDRDVAVAVSPTVSVYVDQVPMPYSVMTEGAALDLERVEILKGPQGTLFGQNSTGGAINFIAAKPTDHFTAGADVTYGRFNEEDLKGFVSGPLSDSVSARLAVGTEHRDDWQYSETRDATLGHRNFSDGRFLLDWKPRDDLRFEFNANGWVNKSDTQAAQFVLYSSTTNPPSYTDEVAAFGITVRYRFN